MKSKTPSRRLGTKRGKSRGKSTARNTRSNIKLAKSDAKLLKKEGVRTMFKLLQIKIEEYSKKRHEKNERMLMQYRDL